MKPKIKEQNMTLLAFIQLLRKNITIFYIPKKKKKRLEFWYLQMEKCYKEGQTYCELELDFFCTNDTMTVTSSSLPPVYPTYPAAWAASANGVLTHADRPTSWALMAKYSAISWATRTGILETAASLLIIKA